MLRLLRRSAEEFLTVEPGDGWTMPDDTVWLDLCAPTRPEELAVEKALGLDLPTREEAAHIEPSSRLYQENGATFMTVTLLGHSTSDKPRAEPVTFVLARGALVTIRYHEMRAFEVFEERICELAEQATEGSLVMLGLLEAIVERLAEILDKTSGRVEAVAHDIFNRKPGGTFKPVLTELAVNQSINAKARDSLVSLGRLIGFAPVAPELSDGAGDRARLASLDHDVSSLTEHVSYHTQHIAFLLDAALGLINIEQNSIIKIFSVAAVVFLPPTLVASIYGMNFQHMPELRWMAGYPMALGLMVISMIIPLWWFKRRGWL